MSLTQSERKLKAALAARTNTDAADWYLVLKARYGMLAAFSAARAVLGDGEAVTQLFTCCTAVTPIIQAGLEPVYADVSSRSASVDPAHAPIGDRTRIAVLQHTFGMVDEEESRRLVERAHAAGAPVLEDCAHCVCRLARDGQGMPLADVSIHSFGVEKILPSHFGGAVWINPASPFAQFANRLRSELSELPAPGVRLDTLLRLYHLENGIMAHLPAGVSHAVRHGMASLGLFEAAVSDAELAGRLPLRTMRPGAWAAERARAALDGLDGIERVRRKTVAAYREAFETAPRIGVFPAAMEGPEQPLLRFPVLLPDTPIADAAVEAVRAAGYYAQAWYRPELGPGVSDPAAYRVPADRSGLPVHERLVATIAVLPADVGADAARRAADAVIEAAADAR